LRSKRLSCTLGYESLIPTENPCGKGLTGEGVYGSLLMMKGDQVKLQMIPGEDICAVTDQTVIYI
jgi:hypothetical protein